MTWRSVKLAVWPSAKRWRIGTAGSTFAARRNSSSTQHLPPVADWRTLRFDIEVVKSVNYFGMQTAQYGPAMVRFTLMDSKTFGEDHVKMLLGMSLEEALEKESFRKIYLRQKPVEIGMRIQRVVDSSTGELRVFRTLGEVMELKTEFVRIERVRHRVWDKPEEEEWPMSEITTGSPVSRLSLGEKISNVRRLVSWVWPHGEVALEDVTFYINDEPQDFQKDPNLDDSISNFLVDRDGDLGDTVTDHPRGFVRSCVDIALHNQRIPVFVDPNDLNWISRLTYFLKRWTSNLNANK